MADKGLPLCDGLADAALAVAGVSICHVDSRGVFAFDATAQAVFDVPAESRLATLLARTARSSRRELAETIRTVMSAPESRSCEIDFASRDGRPIRVRVRAHMTEGHCPGACVVVTLIDVTAEHAAIEALRQSEEHLRYTVEYNPQLPWIADANGRVIDVTDRWLAWSGMTREVALGEGWLHVAHPEDAEFVANQIVHAVQSGEKFDVRARLCLNGEYRWIRAQGYPRRDEKGNVIRWYGYTEDIHEHVLVENQTRWNADHDQLTGLINRTLFNTSLEEALGTALQSLRRVGVLLIDLDHFKEVNDIFGHHAGDALLQSYADQLRAVLPPNAVIARLGGDEFAVLFPRLEAREELLHWGEAIIGLRQGVAEEGGAVDCRASIGAAIYPEHGQQSSELMRHADIAMYAAKEGGRGKLLLFEARMQDEVRERAAMVTRARTAADNGDILAFYQPKVSLSTGALMGFEALLRWRDGNGQIHAPGSIHAAFEDTEVADLLGQKMLEHVVADIVRWRAAGLSFGSIALNAAPAEFRRVNFAPRLIRAIAESGVGTDAIEVEITEGVFLGRGADHAKEAINTLSDHGIAIVLDDFGTGFASLSHLRALPVDTMKIDRSFISEITEANGDGAIVSAIVNLGRTLGIKVVAEGIETIAQADALRAFGCEFAQGYFFGRPTPADQIADLIRNWRSAPPTTPTGRKKITA